MRTPDFIWHGCQRRARLLLLLLWAWPAASPAQPPALEQYLAEGLENNLALQQKEFAYQKSTVALKEARGLFLPAASIEARYSWARGGRTIVFPVGDLMNPVYQTLNEFLTAVGEPARFPESIDNQEFTFLREREHDTKVRVVQPVFQPKILLNYQIKQALSQMKQAEKEAYKRQLVEEITSGYYQYLIAQEVERIYAEAEDLLDANLKVVKSLIRHDRLTRETQYRVEAELSEIAVKQAEARKNVTMARFYFNFLLNRPLDAAIEMDTTEGITITELPQMETALQTAPDSREEMAQLMHALAANRKNVQLQRSGYLPTIAGVFDYGFEGEEYRFTDEDDYWIASFVLSWNLFSGLQNKHKIEQAQLEQLSLETKKEELNRQIALQVTGAWHTLTQSLQAIEAARAKVKSAEKNHYMVERKFRENQTSHIDLLDAQHTLTQSKIQLVVAEYQLQIQQAHWERVAGISKIDY